MSTHRAKLLNDYEILMADYYYYSDNTIRMYNSVT